LPGRALLLIVSAPTTAQAAALAAITTGEDDVQRMRMEVACVTGNAFGETSGRYVRVSCATAYEKIEQALEKMRRFVQRHG
jgi:aspartate/methionine/tyrosine aminotransferase